MNTIRPTTSLSCTDNIYLSITGSEHHEHDGKCAEPACNYDAPHNHTSEFGCIACIRSYLERIFPLEKTIKDLNINNTSKQFLSMVSNLTPALAMSEITNKLHIDSLIASPLAIGAMHLTNRGKDKLSKLFLTSLSSIGVICAQKFLSLPRILIRPFMSLAVFFIERNNKEMEKHVHSNECDHEHLEHQHHNEHSSNPSSFFSKNDLVKLLKLQVQINTIPGIINLLVNKLKERNDEANTITSQILGKIGIFATRVIGLSTGFIGLGHIVDNVLLRFNMVTNEEAIAMRAEAAVCACCGAPVCVAEAASEVGAMSAIG